MAADASAYAVLGLDRGADAAEVDRAYRRLIKQYHPDRAGGDPGRAAEITRAYRELRRNGPIRESLELDRELETGTGRRAWIHIALWIAVALGALFLVTDPARHMSGGLAAGSAPGLHGAGTAATPPNAEPMDLPLSTAAIDRAVQEAEALGRSSDEMALAEASRACHRQMRTKPSVAQLDRCAAFDDAVVQLQDRDPLRDRGPFSELAVTGRLMSSATLLSTDYLAIEGRLDRIRLRVELALAPVLPDPPDANEAAVAESD